MVIESTGHEFESHKKCFNVERKCKELKCATRIPPEGECWEKKLGAFGVLVRLTDHRTDTRDVLGNFRFGSKWPSSLLGTTHTQLQAAFFTAALTVEVGSLFLSLDGSHFVLLQVALSMTPPWDVGPTLIPNVTNPTSQYYKSPMTNGDQAL